MRAVVAVLLLGVIAPAAHADDTFEAKATGAQRIRRIDDLVWALTASCDAGDDTQQRQCRKLRDTRAAELANATLIVDGDKGAFTVGAWSPQKKSVPLALNSCIRCGGISVDGKTWFVVGNKEGNPPPTWKGPKLQTGSLHDNARTFTDEASAKAWAKSAARSSVQLIVKVSAKTKQTIEMKNVLVLDVLGYRVYSPCDGSVVCASPRSGTAELDKTDKKACGTVASGTTRVGAPGETLEALTPALIAQTMKPVADTATQCGTKHGVHGQGKVRITVAADGSVVSTESSGAFANTKAGECIEAAVKQTAFPRSKREKTTFSYPIKLQ
jgi:hypothetical protein